MRVARSALMVLLVGLAGCTDANAPPSQQAEPVGAIEGVVISSESAPVVGATVRLDRGNRAVATTDAGRFRFDNVSAGDHRVDAAHDLFEPAGLSVTVVAGNVTKASLTLKDKPRMVAYVDAGYSFQGSFGPIVWAEGGGQTASAPPSDAQPKTTGKAEIGAGWQTILYEVDWEPSTSQADQMRLNVTLETSNQEPTPVGSVDGGRPLAWRINATDTLPGNARAEEVLFAGFNVGPAGGPDGVGVFAEQRFTVFVTVSYLEPLPGNYTRMPPE